MSRAPANDTDSVAPMQRLGAAFLQQMDRQDRIRFMSERPDEAIAALRLRGESGPAFSLTPRQSDALEFIREHHGRTGTSPTFGEIAAGIGLTTRSGVKRLVDALEERGHIRRIPGRRQSIVIVEGRS